ncbi:MAG: tetratricopeptide repeat protein [Candidatus Cyclobacteriaceae bacterium M3_2C_046]
MKRARFIIIGLICIFTSFIYDYCKAQESDIDSLKVALNNTTDTREKVDILNKIADIYHLSDIEKSNEFSDLALDLAIKDRYKKGVAESYFVKGKAFAKNEDPDKAIYYLQESSEYYDDIDDESKVAECKNNMGIVCKNKGEYKKAIQYFNESLDIAENLEDYDLLADIYSNKGLVYNRSGDHYNAIKYYLESKKIREKINDKKGIAISLGNMGNVYLNQGLFQKAIQHYDEAHQIFTEIGDKLQLGIALNNVGIIYRKINKYDSALYFYNQAYDIYQELGWDLGLASILSNKARIYTSLNDYESSLESSLKALDIFKKLDNSASLAGIYIEIGTIYLELNDMDSAFDYINMGLKLSKSIGDKLREMDGYEALYSYYEKQNQYQQALAFHRKYAMLKDTLTNKEKLQQINDLKNKYEIEQREQENELLKQQFLKKELENKVLIGGVIFIFLFATYFYHTNQQKKRSNSLLSQQNEEINKKQLQIININESLQKSQKQLHKVNEKLQVLNSRLESTVKNRTYELQKSNEELDTFLYQSSHALRRPIVNILGLVQIARIEPLPENIPQIYEKIDDTASRMDMMLKKLVMVSEINLAKPEKTYIDIPWLISESLSSLGPNLLYKDIIIEKNVNLSREVQSDYRLLSIILQNLIENSINFFSDHQRQSIIKLNFSWSDNGLNIEVYDNGIGIPIEVVSNVFDMFMIATNRSKGYGLGLYIAKKAVDKLKGKIYLDSKELEYTSVKIHIPVD